MNLFLASLLVSTAWQAGGLIPAQELHLTLLHGQNHEIENQISAEHPLRKSLDPIIGFERYQILAESHGNVAEAPLVWSSPRDGFLLKLMRVEETEGMVSIELSQREVSLFTGQYKPKPEKPLIITGPLYSKGRLVFVLTNPNIQRTSPTNTSTIKPLGN